VAVAALHPGIPALGTRGTVGAGRGAGATRGAPEVHAARASASAAAAVPAENLTGLT
jgi:hypothetical protein